MCVLEIDIYKADVVINQSPRCHGHPQMPHQITLALRNYLFIRGCNENIYDRLSITKTYLRKKSEGVFGCMFVTIYPHFGYYCILGTMFSFQPNKLRHILKCVSWYIIQHVFVPACSVWRKTWFSRKPWLSNSRFGISGSFWPILSVPKKCF